jgi:fucose permease
LSPYHQAGITGVGEMTQFFVLMYGLLTMFVVLSMQRNQQMQQPTPQMMTMVGWGLFSLSSTLAILFGAVAMALALGVQVPLGSFEAMF